MKDIKRKILILCMLLALGCTQSSQRVFIQNVLYVKIAFLPKGINPNFDISECNHIFQYKTVLQDTIITNGLFIINFANIVNGLEESNESIDYDFRISCLIFFKDESKPHRLCLGEGYLTVYNDVLMKDNKELFKLLDEVLYTKSISKTPRY